MEDIFKFTSMLAIHTRLKIYIQAIQFHIEVNLNYTSRTGGLLLLRGQRGQDETVAGDVLLYQ